MTDAQVTTASLSFATILDHLGAGTKTFGFGELGIFGRNAALNLADTRASHAAAMSPSAPASISAPSLSTPSIGQPEKPVELPPVARFEGAVGGSSTTGESVPGDEVASDAVSSPPLLNLSNSPTTKKSVAQDGISIVSDRDPKLRLPQKVAAEGDIHLVFFGVGEMVRVYARTKTTVLDRDIAIQRLRQTLAEHGFHDAELHLNGVQDVGSQTGEKHGRCSH
ncbi:MAG TPA: hypothetical protein VHL34_21430 [Rhizomicrobium sp.]|nr:hypothetical protein [Rhizomicrobium sp.]